VTLAAEGDGSLCADVDPGQIQQALTNLALNAIQATKGGGTVAIRIGKGSSCPDEVFIAVEDMGSGIPAEHLDRIFEPFFTTKEAGGGTGLGLSTVYGFARQSKGAITLDSAPGAGTTVTLYIPQFAEARRDAAHDAGRAGALPPGLKVTAVEVESEVRAVVNAFLDALGCEVTLFASAEQALLALDDEQFAPDLVLTDIALGPGMRGTELARRVREQRPGTPVLLMSGYSSELLEAESQEPGMRQLLRKPFTRDELSRAITRTLAGAG
jgi:CheY-like chemotaxis protein